MDQTIKRDEHSKGNKNKDAEMKNEERKKWESKYYSPYELFMKIKCIYISLLNVIYNFMYYYI